MSAVRPSSQASQLPQGNAFQLWELACLRWRQRLPPCTHCIKSRPQMHLPAPPTNGEKTHLSSVR
ncbi:hypothetical protein C7A12_16455 [Pseudomonas fluorescens]|nr:hypothetical protein C7A12_16455 [Pseudomonas fluorescens]PRW77078.1 hypothetical protein C7A13_16065 [Pseudomonas fluorescens]